MNNYKNNLIFRTLCEKHRIRMHIHVCKEIMKDMSSFGDKFYFALGYFVKFVIRRGKWKWEH